MITAVTHGPVLVASLDLRETCNALDGPTARALADAFRAFDADASLSVAGTSRGTATAHAHASERRPTTPDSGAWLAGAARFAMGAGRYGAPG